MTAGDSKAPPWNSEDGNALIELGDISVETNVETEFEPQLFNKNLGHDSRKFQRQMVRGQKSSRGDAWLDLD